MECIFCSVANFFDTYKNRSEYLTYDELSAIEDVIDSIQEIKDEISCKKATNETELEYVNRIKVHENMCIGKTVDDIIQMNEAEKYAYYCNKINKTVDYLEKKLYFRPYIGPDLLDLKGKLNTSNWITKRLYNIK